jgi:hypothetical protein
MFFNKNHDRTILEISEVDSSRETTPGAAGRCRKENSGFSFFIFARLFV